MKTTFYIILLFLGAILSSCDKEIETSITVQLNPSFITLGEGTNEPMKMPMKMESQIQSDSDPIYAIQVYENDVPYYYGLFNDVTKMQLALTTSKSYKFKVTAFKTGTGQGLKTLTDVDGVNYYLPNKVTLNNKFIQGDLLKSTDLTSSVILNGQQKDYPEIDGFYATKTVTIDKGTTTIDFTLLRMGFGLNLNVDALTSGDMEVYLGNDTIKLNSAKASSSTVRLFNVLNGDFNNIHSKADTYGDSILLKVKWTGTNGSKVNTQGKFLFNRNYQKTINIQLNTLTGGLTFENWFPSIGLVAWYPFNGNANDESGNGNNGTISGATMAEDRFGHQNEAYSFDGNDIITAKSITFNDLTISFWVNANSSSNFLPTNGHPPIGSQLIGQGTQLLATAYSDYAIGLTRVNSKQQLAFEKSEVGGTGYQMNYFDYTFSYNNWEHIIIVVNHLNLYFYRNGVLTSTSTIKSSLIKSGKVLSIGARYVENSSTPISNFLIGKIDDIGIWNRALTSEEMTALFNKM